MVPKSNNIRAKVYKWTKNCARSLVQNMRQKLWPIFTKIYSIFFHILQLFYLYFSVFFDTPVCALCTHLRQNIFGHIRDVWVHKGNFSIASKLCLNLDMICFLLYFSQNYFLKIIKISVWTKKKVSFKNFYDLIFMIVSPSRYFRVFMGLREKSVWGARELCHFFNPFFASFCSKRRIPAGERVKAPSSGD